MEIYKSKHKDIHMIISLSAVKDYEFCIGILLII